MARLKEPKFMKELHKVRVAIAEEWKKMTTAQIIASLRGSGDRMKLRLVSGAKHK